LKNTSLYFLYGALTRFFSYYYT